MYHSGRIAIAAFAAVAFIASVSTGEVLAQTCVPVPSGIVAWWPGDGNANDIVDGNQGVLQNGAGFTAGIVGQAFSLDGVDDYVSFVDRPVAELIGSQFTIEYWANPGSTPDRPTWGFLDSSFYNRLNPIASYDSFLTFGDGANSQYMTALPNAAANAWTHYAIVGDGTTYRVYVNGAESYNAPISVHPASAGSRTFAIGQSGFDGGFAEYFHGALDEFSIYSRALSASEIAGIFAAGSTGKCSVCGDGIVEPSEQCDDGNTTNGDGCDNNCTFTGCGNFIVTAGEQCDDGNTVSGDCCSATCQFEASGQPCVDDGNACTVDQCDGSGVCAHPASPANTPCTTDGNACTDDVCDGSGMCTHPASPANAPCTTDGNVCTDDVCDGSGLCTHLNNTASCDDGLFCNGADSCSGGACTHAGNPCAPGPECVGCNEADHNCFDPAGTACTADVNPCTLDQCDGAGACAHPAGNAGAICRVATGQCDVAETCTGTSITCPADAFQPPGTACTADTNPCTLDQCNGSGACAHPAGNAGAICRVAAGQCDVAETCTGTSITCPTDAFQPDGTPCNDGNACTSGDACTTGTCAGGPPTVCPLCDTCTPGGGCITAPHVGCKLPTAPGKALLTIKNKTPDTGDGVGFKWSPGAATTLAELGDPLSSNDYALCVYAGVGNTLIFRGTAPAGGMCGGLACWSPLGAHGFKYGDVDLTPDGTMKLQLKSGLAGKAKASFKGKGVNLSNGLVGLPTPPLALPLRAQLQAENGACFEADFSTPIKNDAGLFKAKGE